MSHIITPVRNMRFEILIGVKISPYRVLPEKFVILYEKSAPVGIRTRVAGSKGRNDWPDYTTGANNLSSPERIRTAVAGSKGQHD